MDQKVALTVLVQAAQVAQSKGAFSLQEAGVVAQAVAAFTARADQTPVIEEVGTEETEEQTSED